MKFFAVLAAVALAVALAAALAVLYAVAFHPIVKERGVLSAQLAELQRTNALLEAEVAELRRRQDDFRTDEEYVELEARRNGLSRPGETVFDFSVGAPGGR